MTKTVTATIRPGKNHKSGKTDFEYSDGRASNPGRTTKLFSRATEIVLDKIREFESKITVAELAHVYSVPPSTVRAWAKRGLLTPLARDDGMPGFEFAVKEVISAIKDGIAGRV